MEIFERKTFITIWIDNMETGIYHGIGIQDDTGKAITQSGEMYDAMMGHNMDMKTVTTYISENRFTVVMYLETGGKEFKSMEMVYSRKNKPKTVGLSEGRLWAPPLNFLKIKALK